MKSTIFEILIFEMAERKIYIDFGGDGRGTKIWIFVSAISPVQDNTIQNVLIGLGGGPEHGMSPKRKYLLGVFDCIQLIVLWRTPTDLTYVQTERDAKEEFHLFKTTDVETRGGFEIKRDV